MVDMPVLPDQVRATLPPVVAAYLAALEAAVQRLTTANAALQAQVAELAAQVGQNSTNASRPPSSDPPAARGASLPTRGPRRPGGQAGHVGHCRLLRPTEQVDRVVRAIPATCGQCGEALTVAAGPADPPDVRHQVLELPPVPVEVTEYRRAVGGAPLPALRPPDPRPLAR